MVKKEMKEAGVGGFEPPAPGLGGQRHVLARPHAPQGEPLRIIHLKFWLHTDSCELRGEWGDLTDVVSYEVHEMLLDAGLEQDEEGGGDHHECQELRGEFVHSDT